MKELIIGDTVFTINGGQTTISGLTYVPQPLTVYNITVGDLHSYFVGDSGILVHNKAKLQKRPGNNLAQNKQYDAAVRDAGGLNHKQREMLHREAQQNDWGYHEIRERAIELKKKGY